MEPAQDPYKKWGIIFLAILLVVIPSEIVFLKNGFNFIKNSGKNSSISNKNSTSQFNSYFIVLEYDPNSKTTVKIDSGGFSGESDEFKKSPSPSSSMFSYKVETYSKSGQLISSGWASKSKFAITGENGKYQFRIYVPYQLGNTVKVSLNNNEILWSGQIL